MAEAMVSVIIPVYNSGRYIRHAVECVLCQTYEDWELILVDDGSTDATSRICQEYADMSRVRYIRNSQNSGVSAARNLGMDAACGKYIVFMDADDTMGENSLKVRVELMENHGLDMGVFNSRIIVDGKEPEERNLTGIGRFGTAGFLRRISDFQAGINLGIDSVWDKIFRTDRIQENEVRFCEGWHMFEDWLFCLEYMDVCRGVIEVADISVMDYHMRSDNDNSLSWKFHRREFQCTFKVINDYFERLGSFLKAHELFAGDIRDGFYHGYINKVIGEIYSYVKMGGACREQLNMIFDTDDFSIGLEGYICRNKKEDSGIIEVLKQKDADMLCSYVEMRLRGDSMEKGRTGDL